ncbi:ATP-dependent Zn protease [Cordyceps fumosorosea ARSEF 2679]|uniref:ATP-dependent Zn protease n=1 Tax=Cordyceps fumosorosea (strain ARSEF 2679) TaxID=1081104 RepID=A0A168AJT7_CORFA|nr:ATP-dependent Zn protease [Cordyceps fumosorosea ARSEF 2679]OAA68846.1 ATP-dependent Zn protease [Cordyceps fumosorosea ARSEF 2679]
MSKHSSRRSGHSTDSEAAWHYFKHSGGKRTNTNAILATALKKQYPTLHLSIVPAYTADILAFASSGQASFTEVEDDTGDDGVPASLGQKLFVPPPRRGDGGVVIRAPTFAKFLYQHGGHEFIVYLARAQDGTYDVQDTYYILSTDEARTDALVRAAGAWASVLHNEIWVFDGGFWRKDAGLYASVMKASWDAVILDEEMKTALIEDHLSFFRSRATYRNLKVPWKRGIIYYGPPGNGKTISIKAMMHTLYKLTPEVPTLYVRTLASFFGPEDSIKKIFARARQFAPCYLVFEDLDSLVSDSVRSYFLNEVDGLQSNDGIFMIGSTNHLDRLDPGIAKRPSRFDRKYLFPNPNLKERIAYCHFWQSKLAGNKSIEFPDKLCEAIAGITDAFSFAYMQEAFVAALLAIARSEGRDDDDDDDSVDDEYGVATVDLADEWVGVVDPASRDDVDLEHLKLWVEIKKQIRILREGIKEDPEE